MPPKTQKGGSLVDEHTEPEQEGSLENWEPLPTSEHMEITPGEKMLDELLKGFQPAPSSGTVASNGTVESWEPLPNEIKHHLSPNGSGPVGSLSPAWQRLLRE